MVRRLGIEHNKKIFGSEGEIRTHDFRDLQSLAFDHSATSP